MGDIAEMAPDRCATPGNDLFQEKTDYKCINVSTIMGGFDFVETDAVAEAICDPVFKQLAKDNLAFKKLVAPLDDKALSFVDGLLAERSCSSSDPSSCTSLLGPRPWCCRQTSSKS